MILTKLKKWLGNLPIFSVRHSLHWYVVRWRKYAAFPILIAQILTAIWCNQIVYGCVMALWLTVPCGIKAVNKYKYLWYPRQASFGLMSALELYQGFLQ